MARWLTAVLVSSTLMLIASCSPRAPAASDMIGVWRSDERAEIVFRGDGSFLGHSIPSGLLESAPNGAVEVSGTWEMEVPANRREFGRGQWPIRMDFQRTNSTHKSEVANLVRGRDLAPLILVLGNWEDGMPSLALERIKACDRCPDLPD